ncbi:phosphoribosyltransferase family protein [Actinoplanes sp. NPDC049316]|uniref:phosphoribosyltransferase n=1 Tax=Actinoplanes sp. NPDC049316 TaxID=3154727 RepID=UPI00341D1489
MTSTAAGPLFSSRPEAGRRLAGVLSYLRGPDVVVLGLPRGGVPVAAEVARALDAPLDVVVVRRVTVPGRPDLVAGAVSEEDMTVVDTEMIKAHRVSWQALHRAERIARAAVEYSVAVLRSTRWCEPLVGRTALIVDDGMATGATARVACLAARARGADRVVVAVPVARPGASALLAGVADGVVCLHRLHGLVSVGQAYRDLPPVSDEELLPVLARAAARPRAVRG